MSATDDVKQSLIDKLERDNLLISSIEEDGPKGLLERDADLTADKVVTTEPWSSVESKNKVKGFAKLLFDKFGDTNNFYSLDVSNTGNANFQAFGGMVTAGLDLNEDAAFEFISDATTNLISFIDSVVEDLTEGASLVSQLSTNLPSIGFVDFTDPESTAFVNTKLIADLLPKASDALFVVTAGYKANKNIQSNPASLATAVASLNTLCAVANEWTGTPLQEWQRIIADLCDVIDRLEVKLSNLGSTLLNIIDGAAKAAGLYTTTGEAMSYNVVTEGMNQVESMIESINSSLESSQPDAMPKTALDVTLRICTLKQIIQDTFDAVSGAKFDPLVDVELSFSPGAVAYKVLRAALEDEVDDINELSEKVINEMNEAKSGAQRVITEKDFEVGVLGSLLTSLALTISSLLASLAASKAASEAYTAVVKPSDDVQKMKASATTTANLAANRRMETWDVESFSPIDSQDPRAAADELIGMIVSGMSEETVAIISEAAEALYARSNLEKIAGSVLDGRFTSEQGISTNITKNLLDKIKKAESVIAAYHRSQGDG
jgi:hypothetical protein